MSHDNSYKLFFSHPEMVADLLKGFVKQEWVAQCDFTTLEKVSGSYVTDDLRDREDDVIWRIQCGEEWLYVYLLLEFQSRVDHFMAVRMLGYLGLLYQDIIRTQKLGKRDLLPPVLPLVLYNGEQRWNAPLELDKLIYPAPAGLEKYRPQLRFLLLDEGNFTVQELSGLKNLVAALFRLENSRSEQDIQSVVRHLLNWLNAEEQTGLRRSFTVWFNRVLLPRKLPFTDLSEFQTLQEVDTMLAETIKNWKKQAKIEGMEKGLEKGMEMGLQQGVLQGRQELFLLMLNSKFGELSQDVHAKVRQSSPEKIEKWTKRIFSAETPEALLDS
jgi:predicted transposase/invertase (TIGR01784 family)